MTDEPDIWTPDDEWVAVRSGTTLGPVVVLYKGGDIYLPEAVLDTLKRPWGVKWMTNQSGDVAGMFVDASDNSALRLRYRGAGEREGAAKGFLTRRLSKRLEPGRYELTRIGESMWRMDRLDDDESNEGNHKEE